ANTAQQRAVRECWQLDALLPEAGAGVSATPAAPLLDTLNRQLAIAREQWDEFCAGTAVALTRFEDAVAAMQAPVAPLERPATQALVEGILGFARWLRRDPLLGSEATAMEIATALLLLEAGLERRPPQAGFSARVEAMLARLQSLQRGEALLAGGSDDVLATASPSQEKALLEQLAREMLASLGQVEQALDDFFRNPARREPLLQLHQPLQQIVGALSVLGETDALALVRDAGVRIASLANTESRAGQPEFEALAHRLSALGFFIEALPRGGAVLQDLLDTPSRSPAEASLATADEAPAELAAEVATEIAPEIAPETPPEISPTVATETTPDAAPASLGAAAEAQAAPATLSETAPPPPDDEEGDLTLIEDLEDLETLAAFEPAPAQPAAPLPAEAMPVAPPPAEAEVDAELLGIFIEEAVEVLATLRTCLQGLRDNPGASDDLVTIRRGFHTLKGSGRMVGLTQLGDTAWAVEQTLNRWLQLDWPVTPALLGFIEHGETVFAAWVERLQRGESGPMDASQLEAEAERLRNASEAPVDSAPAPQPAETPARESDIEAMPLEAPLLEASLPEAPVLLAPIPEAPLPEAELGAAEAFPSARPDEHALPDEPGLAPLSEPLLHPTAPEPVAEPERLEAFEDLEDLEALADLGVPPLPGPEAAEPELPEIPEPEAAPLERPAPVEDEQAHAALDLLVESADFLIDGELGEPSAPVAATSPAAAGDALAPPSAAQAAPVPD
ncbi:MAG TPA: hybrid sensor histidine kinase/response regulator, partial [Thauera sp.]|nr:hybrid sensor histidine kinase/response regulator [Thauera sp.]